MIQPHEYKNLTTDEYEELFSNYLIDSWSYSKVSSFARNEKGFEMIYIYRSPATSSASTVAGQAYHTSLDFYFECKKDGIEKDLVDLQRFAIDFIDELPANSWKLQKTTPTIEACVTKATKLVMSLIENFMMELSVYDFEEILHVEIYFDEFLTINGVDIPLPCHARADMVVKTKEGKVIIIDHKSKNSFSDEKELAFSVGKQAVTYYHCLISALNIKADEVWFIENKYSKNRNKAPQLNLYPITMDKDTVKLYDSMLYEPLKRMIEAISNPDYVYLMNEEDNFIDKAELHAFWAQTMIAEVDDFDIPDEKKPLIERRLKKIRDASIGTINPSIIKKFRKNASEFIQFNLNNKDMTREDKIEHILRTLSIVVKVCFKFEGYSSDVFLLEASAGTNLASIQRYKLDIANALNVASIRINKSLFIYQDKSYLAVEAPKKRQKDLYWDKKYLDGYKIPIGLDNFKMPVVWDLNNQSTPHVLICGATGCLAANTKISVHIPHYKNPSKTKTIKTLFNIQNGNPNKDGRINNKNKNILVRSLDETTNNFTYNPFEVIYSGEKQCYKITTKSGHIIESTMDHRFLTKSGWYKLSELNVGDSIMYRPSVREFTGKKKQLKLKNITVKYHPRRSYKTIIDKKNGKSYKYKRVPYHHFVYEADRNNLSIDEYKNLLDNYDGRSIFYVPEGNQIDHKDGDRNNNYPSNLQMFSISEHAYKTLKTAKDVFGYFRPKDCEILTIEKSNIKETYDISCKSDNHNFIANGLVVHNSGKSVCIISMLEYVKLLDIDDIVIFDPKYEFVDYDKESNISVYNDIDDIEAIIELLVEEMNRRVINKITSKKIIIFDEFADALASSTKGNALKVYEEKIVGNYKNGEPKYKNVHINTKKSLEENLKILGQKGRSCGFRIIAATQRASVKVITGDAKVNFPVQICFKVPKEVDSKVVLDEAGAESLMGKGDGLINSPEYMDIIRFQSFYKK